MDWEKQIGKVVLTFVVVIILGVAGLMTVEGWSFQDALYMTILTLSTVGYREVRPLSPAGQIFIMIFIVIGVGSFLFVITTIAEYVVFGHLKGAVGRKKMKNRISKLTGHYIICGFGRVGQEVAQELKREGNDLVVIDITAASIGKCDQMGYNYIEGNASDEQVLIDAGIMKAAGLVTATDSDAENVYVTLSAKDLRKDIYVVARASTEGARGKLFKAGADRVISPYSIGGKRIAGMLLRPNVVEFLDFVLHSAEMDLFMEEIEVREKSRFDGLTVGAAKQMQNSGANILAIKKKLENKIVASPETTIKIERGDLLIILGTKGQLKDLEQFL
ncbi:MAG: potassium channel protein [Nitrospirae bacterium]|nr:potassium channel protein [Nitrospirota bacterium]